MCVCVCVCVCVCAGGVVCGTSPAGGGDTHQNTWWLSHTALMAEVPKERAGLMEQLSTGMATKCATVTARPTTRGAVAPMWGLAFARTASVAAMTVKTSKKVQPNSTP